MPLLLILFLVGLIFLGWVSFTLLPFYLLILKLAIVALIAFVIYFVWEGYREARRTMAWNDLDQEERERVWRQTREAYERREAAKPAHYETQAATEHLRARPPASFSR